MATTFRNSAVTVPAFLKKKRDEVIAREAAKDTPENRAQVSSFITPDFFALANPFAPAQARFPFTNIADRFKLIRRAEGIVGKKPAAQILQAAGKEATARAFVPSTLLGSESEPQKKKRLTGTGTRRSTILTSAQGLSDTLGSGNQGLG